MKMNAQLWAQSRYFKPSEFTRPDQVEASLIPKLDQAREIAGIPFVITSSHRSAAHNDAVGGADDSAHLRGFAVDIRATTSRSRFHVVRGLIRAGFTRIGVYSTHVHGDVDPSLSPSVLWLG